MFNDTIFNLSLSGSEKRPLNGSKTHDAGNKSINYGICVSWGEKKGKIKLKSLYWMKNYKLSRFNDSNRLKA